MMQILINSLLFLHVAAGLTTLIAGPFAIFYNWNNAKAHRRAGKIFFFAMLLVCITSVLTFARHPEKVFYQFLFALAFMVAAQVSRGVRAIFLMKGKELNYIDYSITGVLGVSGAGMLAYGLSLWSTSESVALPILFCVFGTGALSDTYKCWKVIRAHSEQGPLDHLKIHIDAMLGGFVASTTAFTVNIAHGLPWYIQWFGPTIVLIPVMVYFGKKLKQKRATARSVTA